MHVYLDIVSVFSDMFMCQTVLCFSKDFLTNQSIVSLPWLARDPDLAPIEHD